jgi:hypothetical protein
MGFGVALCCVLGDQPSGSTVTQNPGNITHTDTATHKTSQKAIPKSWRMELGIPWRGGCDATGKRSRESADPSGVKEETNTAKIHKVEPAVTTMDCLVPATLHQSVSMASNAGSATPATPIRGVSSAAMYASVVPPEVGDVPFGSSISSTLTVKESPGQRALSGVPEGLCFISLDNNRHKFFVPSTKNYFGGVKVDKLLCDSGCTSLLLYFASLAHLEDAFRSLDNENYRVFCAAGVGVTGIDMAIKFKQLIPGSIDCFMSTDLFPNSPAINLLFLRFSLCSEDINHIVQTPHLLSRFGKQDQARLRAEVVRETIHARHALEEYQEILRVLGPSVAVKLRKQTPLVPRKSHGLIGQHILGLFVHFKMDEVEFFCSKEYVLPSTMRILGNQMRALTAQIEVPGDYEEWEEDFAVYDDEDMEIFGYLA